jgi:NAD(P)H-quinone oxidoreductase subunit 5
MTLDMPSIPLTALVLVGIGSPAVLLALLGVPSLLNRPLPERWTGLLAGISMAVSCAALVTALAVHPANRPGSQLLLSFGAWSTSDEGGIAIEFLVDRLSLAFAALSAAIAGVVSAFSNRYLHREAGYNRYFVLLAIFVTGMLLVALAGNVSVLFVGWELVGLSSALLVGFFQERPAAVSNAFRVASVYRISDAAMLSAAVLLRHVAGSDSLSLLFGGAGAPAGLSTWNATAIAILLIVAVAGKSALLPFSGWLPRAMEGPTPSSAVYYGSLSIHAGCFLLLRAAPLLEQAPAARLLAGGLGLATALFAGTTTRVQSDVKSSLAYASLTQVGIIVTEIALGWYTLAFVHLAGHACFRLLQFLSAPNVLHDLHGLADAMGEHARPADGLWSVVGSGRARRWLFLMALERGFLDSVLDRIVVEPFTTLARALTRLDQRLCGAAMPARLPAGADGADRDE